MVDDLRDLPPPPGDEGVLEEYFAAQEGLIEKMRNAPYGLTPEDFNAVAVLSADYGLTASGTPGESNASD